MIVTVGIRLLLLIFTDRERTFDFPKKFDSVKEIKYELPIIRYLRGIVIKSSVELIEFNIFCISETFCWCPSRKILNVIWAQARPPFPKDPEESIEISSQELITEGIDSLTVGVIGFNGGSKNFVCLLEYVNNEQSKGELTGQFAFKTLLFREIELLIESSRERKL
jgi:hypothetical protein